VGWKASCILINERQYGYLGSFPRHDSRRAADLIRRLSLGEYTCVGLASFEAGMFPKEEGQLFVGAYDGAAIIADDRLPPACFSESPDPFVSRLLSVFPKAAVLAVMLHSSVNLFAYAYFEKAALLRVHAGSADDGVVEDWGALLPEEEPFFERSVIQDGQRIFRKEVNGRIEEFPADAFGETLVFEITKRFFGCRLDQLDAWDLQMELFAQVR
jgi:hypothetical protein